MFKKAIIIIVMLTSAYFAASAYDSNRLYQNSWWLKTHFFWNKADFDELGAQLKVDLARNEVTYRPDAACGEGQFRDYISEPNPSIKDNVSSYCSLIKKLDFKGHVWFTRNTPDKVIFHNFGGGQSGNHSVSGDLHFWKDGYNNLTPCNGTPAQIGGCGCDKRLDDNWVHHFSWVYIDSENPPDWDKQPCDKLSDEACRLFICQGTRPETAHPHQTQRAVKNHSSP